MHTNQPNLTAFPWRRNLSIGSSSLLMLTMSFLLATAPLTAAGRDARVLGTVVDEAGERLEGVAVSIRDEEGETVATTNRKGRFSVILADGTKPYIIRLEKEGYRMLEEPMYPKVGQAIAKTWTLIEGTDGPRTNAEAAEAYSTGIEALRAGDADVALEALERSVAADPTFVPGRQGLVLALLSASQWQRAQLVADQILAENPEDTLALKGAYDAAHQIAAHDAAGSYLERLLALEQSTEAAERIFNQAVYYAQSGDLEKGRTMLESAIEMDPVLGQAYLALATLHLDDDQFDEALAVSDRLLAIEADNVDALSIRYEVFRRSGDKENLDLALRALQYADPQKIADAFFQQGSALFEENSLEAAADAFERVLAAVPDDPRTHYMLGKVLTSKGDYEQAVTHLKRFVELAPEDPDVAEAQEIIGYLDN